MALTLPLLVLALLSLLALLLWGCMWPKGETNLTASPRGRHTRQALALLSCKQKAQAR